MNPNPKLGFGKFQGSRDKIFSASKKSQKLWIEIPKTLQQGLSLYPQGNQKQIHKIFFQGK